MAKMLVEIVSGETTRRKRYTYEGNKLIIRKWDKNRNAGYMPTFSKNSLLYYKGFLGLRGLKRKVMLIDGADHCIDFIPEEVTGEDGKSHMVMNVDIPIWDRPTLEKAFRAEVIKASGQVSSKIQIPALLYISIFLSIGMSFLVLLVSTGRLQI